MGKMGSVVSLEPQSEIDSERNRVEQHGRLSIGRGPLFMADAVGCHSRSAGKTEMVTGGRHQYLGWRYK